MRRRHLLRLTTAVTCVAVAGTQLATGTPHASSKAAPTVSVRSTKYGKILINSKGFTLYMWVKDKPNKSACSGGCLSVWPFVIVAGKPSSGRGINQKLLGTITVKVKGKTEHELTYNRFPMYTFVSDTKPGVVSGQGNTTFGGAWWLMSPSGKPITKKS
jgi:predicted lipoprotein with Yx(FWY)xxD motif